MAGACDPAIGIAWAPKLPRATAPHLNRRAPPGPAGVRAVYPDGGSTSIQATPLRTSQIGVGKRAGSARLTCAGFDREEVHEMLVSTRPAEAVEAPGRLQLAIREWQRQLIAMAEAAQSRATHSATAGG